MEAGPAADSVGAGSPAPVLPPDVLTGRYSAPVIGYLDIETSFEGEVTVVGLLRSDRGLVQLVGEAVGAAPVAELLAGIDTICTFNGERFDLPVLSRTLGVDMLVEFRSLDLSVECRRLGIRGGLKRIESSLGISRRVRGVNGYDAMVLWKAWGQGDREALDTLLRYNREDVLNLVLLQRRLHGDLCALAPVQHVVMGT